MKWIRNLPIRHKLIFISLTTSALVLLAVCAAFVAYEHLTFRESVNRDLSLTAHTIGMNSQRAAASGNQDWAKNVLRGLNVNRRVLAAAIYDRAGNEIATYTRDGGGPVAWPEAQAIAARASGDPMEIFQEIPVGGENAPILFLRPDLSQFEERWMGYGRIVVAVFLAAVLMAWLIAAQLQRLISVPVLQLSAVARRVAAGSDFSIRAEKRNDDELGCLTTSINQMLSRIEKQNAELLAVHEQLEHRIEARTAELKRAKEEAEVERGRLRFIFDFVPVGISLFSYREDTKLNHLVNEAHRQICGVTLEDMERDPHIFQKLTHPDDIGRQEELQRRLDEGEIDQFSLEKRYLRANGDITWVVYSTRRKYYADGSVETLRTVTDITDLKNAQDEAAREHARFKFIFEALPVGVAWMIHGRPETRVVNGAFAEISRVPKEQCQDLSLYPQATHPEDAARQLKLTQQIQAGEIDAYEIEKRYRNEGESDYTWAVLSVRWLRGPEAEGIQELCTLVDVTQRKTAEEELANTHRRLLETSRYAGMAEIATNVLHNVGNVLNSVNVSVGQVDDHVRKSKASSVGKLSALFDQHADDLPRFLTEDPQGKQIPGFLKMLAERLGLEQAEIFQELKSLRSNVDHIKEIVAMQQNYAKLSGVTERVAVADLVGDALNMTSGAFLRHEINVVREFEVEPVITVERHKVLQILVNVLRNAKFACSEPGVAEKRITVRVTGGDDRVQISVIDSGVGIEPENLSRIFGHGFTTRADGHGFGLHSGALAAKEMGGSLRAFSEGLGKGASFVLELPVEPPQEDAVGELDQTPVAPAIAAGANTGPRAGG